MKEENKRFRVAAGPFDDSAATRLAHMGLLDGTGQVQDRAVSALGVLMAGLFYDAICDHYNDVSGVRGVYQDLADLHAVGDHRRLLLRYSMQHDMLHEPIPSAVWWLSGNELVVKAFLDRFMERLGALMSELQTEVAEEEAP